MEEKVAGEVAQKSGEWYSSLFNATNDGIFLHDFDARFLDVNERFCEITGYTKEELLSMKVTDIQLPERRQHFFSVLKEIRKKGSMVAESLSVRKDGSTISVEISARYIELGKEKLFLNVYRDITERKETEAALKQTKEFSEIVLNSMNDAISIIDVSDFKIKSVNRAFLKEFDINEEEALGKTCYEITHKQSHQCSSPEHFCPLSSTVKTAEYSSAEHVHYDKKGEEVIVEVSTSPIKDKNEEVVHVVHVARDVTMRRGLEKALEKLNDELEERVEERTKQLTLIQEINNELNSGSSLEEVFNIMTRGINRVFNYDACDIYILEDDPEEIVHVAIDYDSKITKQLEKLIGLKSVGLKIPLFEGSNLKEIIETRKPLVTDDIKGIFADFTDKKALKALAGQAAKISKLKYVSRIPLVAEGEVLGILGVATRNREITEEDTKSLERFASQLALAIRKRKTENTLYESEERYRTLIENARDIVYAVETDSTITSLNPAFEEITGWSCDEWIGKHFGPLFHPDDLPLASKTMESLLKGETPPPHEMRILSKSGEYLVAEFKTTPQLLNGKTVGILGIATDITKRKKAEEELKRRLMRFELEEGNLYMVKESSLFLSLEAFKDILNIGRRGIVFSRMYKEEFKKAVDGNFEFLWLSESGDKETQRPEAGDLKEKIKSLPMKHAVLIDRLDYLISKNGFEEVLHFVQRLRERAYLSRLTIILSIDPSTLSGQELRLLEKETLEVKPRQKTNLSEDLIEILKFVHSNNARGIKPSYTDIRKKLGVSKPTIGKRIRLLISDEYITESKKGMFKVVKLTDRGRDLFLK